MFEAAGASAVRRSNGSAGGRAVDKTKIFEVERSALLETLRQKKFRGPEKRQIIIGVPEKKIEAATESSSKKKKVQTKFSPSTMPSELPTHLTCLTKRRSASAMHSK